jgi:hypothetical protein
MNDSRPPRLEACSFGADPQGIWLRMVRVLWHSAAQCCEHWDRRVQAITPPVLTSALGIASHVENTQKMEHWHHLVNEAPDGARLLLIDADTMILRALDDVWALDFDVAYTTKEARFPFNSGVVFVRVSDRVRAFVSDWRDENRRMLGDREHHQVWRRQFGGINQAALGYMLARGDRHGVQLHTLPCLEWNCEDSSWERFDPAVTRIVHVKSSLRRAIFHRAQVSPRVLPLVNRWRQIERAAMAAESRSCARGDAHVESQSAPHRIGRPASANRVFRCAIAAPRPQTAG